jgi:peptidoglycan/xylan/chitin deacetylase (PgdA/CDA1 family)
VVIQHVVKAALRSAAGRVYSASPHFLTHVTGKVLILMYHRVVPRSEVSATFVQPGMYVTPDTFERHLRFLTAHFRILSFQDLCTRWRDGAWEHGERYCALTFDDGWLDNYRYAYPLLRACHAPATIFLPTDLIGTDTWLWSDRLGYLLERDRRVNGPDEVDSLIEHAKTLSDDAREHLLDTLAETTGVRRPAGRCFLNWDEAREMSRHGIAFGSHTCTHAILTRVHGAALEREVRRSLDTLREQRVNHVPVLAYPNGDHTSEVAAATRAAGYDAAVTTNPGLESSHPADLFRLKRIGVHEDVSHSTPLFTFHVARQARRTARVARPA